MSPQTLQRQRSITPCITDRDPLPDSASDKDPGSPRVGEGTPPLARVTERGGSFRDRSQVPGLSCPPKMTSVTCRAIAPKLEIRNTQVDVKNKTLGRKQRKLKVKNKS